jgi:hypothetical protein
MNVGRLLSPSCFQQVSRMLRRAECRLRWANGERAMGQVLPVILKNP